MSIRINARPKVIGVGPNAGKKVYKLTPEFYSRIDSELVCKHASEHSGLSPLMVRAALAAVASSIKQNLILGHSVELGDLGTLRLSLRAKTASKLTDVNVDKIYRRKLVFTPSTNLQKFIDAQQLEIVCYDEKGKKVRRIDAAREEINSLYDQQEL